jgi:DNA-3-methyladenine glycosylase II
VALVPIPEPYDFALSTERFRAFGVDRATVWHEGGLHRVIAGREVRIEPAPGGVDAEPFDADVAVEVETLLGLPFDLAGFAAWAQEEPVLARLTTELAGFRPPLSPDPFEALVTTITAQQVSLQSAFAIRGRFVERFGVPAAIAVAFPARERVAAATEDELFTLGFSRRKAEYVLGLARSDLDFDALDRLPDEELAERLVAIRGLGEWSADWYLARRLGRPHAWPAGDLALRKAVRFFYPQVEDVRGFGATFHPFQNLAAHYLLAGLRLTPTPAR